MAKLISQAQFSRRTKYSPARVSQLVRDGVIILVDGLVDPIQAEAAIREKIVRRWRLRGQMNPSLQDTGVCNECQKDGAPQSEDGEFETFFCSLLNLRITRRKQKGEDPA